MYFDILQNNDALNNDALNNSIKISDKQFVIPCYENYSWLLKHNYKVTQLKQICKYYKLHSTGKKRVLINKLYNYLKYSCYAIKIQRQIRRRFVEIYQRSHGPAYKNRSICNNTIDFYSMEELEDIPYSQFISYKDNDNFIYGFDVISLYNLIKNAKYTAAKNPYNRQILPENTLKNIKRLVSLSKILGISIDIKIDKDMNNLSRAKSLELRALALFQEFNSLGNYADLKWFLDLNISKLYRFERELYDIWNYRANLTYEAKYAICPPHGDPFRNIVIHRNASNIFDLQSNILTIMENIVNNSVDQANKALGAYYILAALTLVNQSAATALPWLYSSVVVV